MRGIEGSGSPSCELSGFPMIRPATAEDGSGDLAADRWRRKPHGERARKLASLCSIEDSGQLDNTFILYCADNGASSEGRPNGSVNETQVLVRAAQAGDIHHDVPDFGRGQGNAGHRGMWDDNPAGDMLWRCVGPTGNRRKTGHVRWYGPGGCPVDRMAVGAET